MAAQREIRAGFDRETLVVYQAYAPAIAGPALAAQRFVPPFSFNRMTWIKPSFLWLMELAIQRADYRTSKRELRVDATSSNASATLTVFATSSNQQIGTLGNLGGGRFSGTLTFPVNPVNITVRSSSGGSASRAVTVR